MQVPVTGTMCGSKNSTVQWQARGARGVKVQDVLNVFEQFPRDKNEGDLIACFGIALNDKMRSSRFVRP